LGDDETDIAWILYNDLLMEPVETENLVIGVLAGIGVLVLLVMFVYVVKQVFKKES
jgi:hypothetical protein